MELLYEEKLELIDNLYPTAKLFNLKSETKNVKCPNPSHKDSRPSCHIYDKVKLWCFKCKRFYSNTEIIKFFNLDVERVFDDLLIIYEGKNILEINKTVNLSKKKEENVIKKRDTKENLSDYTRNFFKDYID